MDRQTIQPKTIDEYIITCPEEVQDKLRTFRMLIRSEAPEAEETIKYRIPTFMLNGKNLIHFACFKNHIGFYPTPSPIEEFEKELKPYKYSKGAIQFPLDKTLPLALIRKMVRYRIKEVNK